MPATLILFLLFACNNKNKNTEETNTHYPIFKKTVDSLFGEATPSPLVYVILPNTGCGGCISSAEQLLVEYVKNATPVKFILTNITSYKVAKATLGESIITSPLVYADKTNILYNKLPDLHQIYPIIFYINNKENPSHFEYVNPDNPDAIPNLRKYIDSCLKASRL